LVTCCHTRFVFFVPVIVNVLRILLPRVPAVAVRIRFTVLPFVTRLLRFHVYVTTRRTPTTRYRFFTVFYCVYRIWFLRITCRRSFCCLVLFTYLPFVRLPLLYIRLRLLPHVVMRYDVPAVVVYARVLPTPFVPLPRYCSDAPLLRLRLLPRCVAVYLLPFALRTVPAAYPACFARTCWAFITCRLLFVTVPLRHTFTTVTGSLPGCCLVCSHV